VRVTRGAGRWRVVELNLDGAAIHAKRRVQMLQQDQQRRRAEFNQGTPLSHGFGHENKVVTERVDQWDWHRSGMRPMPLKVCSIFELTENGKIIEWRESYASDERTRCGGPNLTGWVSF
jgi:limonene-1,2-epoxide hydrolase